MAAHMGVNSCCAVRRAATLKSWQRAVLPGWTGRLAVQISATAPVVAAYDVNTLIDIGGWVCLLTSTVLGAAQESNCKIAIRGRGSVKEGRSRKESKPDPSENEDLHVLVTGDTDEDVDRVRTFS